MTQAPAGNARTCTILFTDIVGSTSLRTKLGDEVADEVRREHDRLLGDAVARHRGVVAKSLGDGIMAVFDAARDAASCAAAMQQVIGRMRRKRQVDVAIRIGLSAGDVAIEDGDWFGTPVVEAARLEAAAEGGQILASDLVRALAGSRTDLAFDPIGPLELKGLAGPLAACSIRWEPLPDCAPIPLPPLMTATGFSFVGRKAEQEVLSAAWEAAAAGAPRTVLVAGDAGIGKSRLVCELTSRVHAEGGVVLAGRCDEDLEVPYQPFVEALQHFTNHAPSYLADVAFLDSATELTRLLPELATIRPDLPKPSQSDPQTERYRLYEAVVSWLAALSDEEPLLVVLEDLHWATRPTLSLLRHIQQSQRAKRLLIVGTYRSTDVPEDHPLAALLADLRRGPDAERLPLEGLDDDAVAAMLREALDRSLSPTEIDLAETIRTATTGNAFFVGEVVRHVVHLGPDRYDPSVVPESVRDAVSRRLAQLPQRVRDVLVAAAAIGPVFEVALTARVAEVDESDTLEALEEADRAHLVDETSLDTYRFAHALVRDTIHAQQSASRRVRMHRKVADAIHTCHGVDLDEHLAALAYHLREVARADPSAAPEALEYTRRAAEQALDRLSPEGAAALYEAALELPATRPADPELRCRLLLGLGKARTWGADFEGARDAYGSAADEARLVGDGRLLAEAAIGFRGPPRVVRDRTRDTALFDEAIAALGGREERPLALVYAYSARSANLDPAEASRRAVEALRLASSLADPEVECNAHLARCWTMFAEHHEREQLDFAQRAVDAARASGSRELLLEALASLFIIADHLAPEIAQRTFVELGEVAERFRDPFYLAVIPTIEARRLIEAGQLDEAESRAATYLAMNQDESTIGSYFAQMAMIRGQQGRADELLDAAPITAASGAADLALAFRLAAILLHLQAGAHDESRAAFEDLVADGFRAITPEGSWGHQLELAQLADICARLDHVGSAEILHPMVAPYERAHASAMVGLYFGPMVLFLGMLSSVLGRDDAIPHLQHARQHLQQTGAVALELRARAELGGAMCRTRPRDNAALRLLSSARTDAEQLGLVDIVRRSDDLMRRATPP